jgi:hypothetical protein
LRKADAVVCNESFCNLKTDMKKILLLTFLILSILSKAQDKTPTPNDIRLAIAKSITDLRVAPEPVAQIINDFVVDGNDSIAIRMVQLG